MTNYVTVVGSLNMDIHIPVAHIPLQGETLSLLKPSSQAAGGKGANQAVAAQRLGAAVHFIGAIGDDDAGKMLRHKCELEGIDVSGVRVVSQANTGQAFIMLEPDGHNTIMVEGGANKLNSVAAVVADEENVQRSQIVMAQLETNLEPIIAAFRLAKAAGALTILNPAPALPELPAELIALTDMITPNETEAATLTGLKVETEQDCEQAAAKFREMGIANVVITLGSRGVFYDVQDKSQLVPAHKVVPVDTTAAGDTFIGAIAAQIVPDLSNIKETIEFANLASSLTVQKLGAMDSIPRKNEVIGK
ncbi:ribokinase [Pediococcus siamensis]|uniref:ribokinase n=1 Tax=Pediococcus siamensis TaxID=381829 RepID=UPI0039A1E413